MKLLHGYGVLLLGFTSLAALAEPADKSRDVFYQVSTINALLAGYFDGILSCDALTRHGDVGLGTFEALDGEMVVLDRTVYQVRVDGTVHAAAPTAMIPFAEVTFFEPDETFNVRGLESLDQLQKAVDRHMTRRQIFYAIRVDGMFAAIKVRSVPKQRKPYPRLAEAIKNQAVFDVTNIKGTLIGFWCPDLAPALTMTGFHLHFLSDDRASGGHVLDCRLIEGKVSLDLTPVLTLQLPERGFGRLDLGGSRVQELNAAER